jgi:hypothetical protein
VDEEQKLDGRNVGMSAGLDADALQAIANAVSAHTPPGFVIGLNIEHGAAWVELWGGGAGYADLPDSAGKTLLEQLNDALCIANGWM